MFSSAAFATGEWEEAEAAPVSLPVEGGRAAGRPPLSPLPHSRGRAGIAGPFLALAPTSVCGC